MSARIPGAVLSVDDNQSFAHLIPRWLAADPDLHHAAHLPTSCALLEFVALLRPTVVVLDLRMSGGHPLIEMRRALAEFPHIRFVVLADELCDGPLRDRAIAAGASCIIEKSRAPTELAGAVRRLVDAAAAHPVAEPKPPPTGLCSCRAGPTAPQG